MCRVESSTTSLIPVRLIDDIIAVFKNVEEDCENALIAKESEFKKQKLSQEESQDVGSQKMECPLCQVFISERSQESHHKKCLGRGDDARDHLAMEYQSPTRVGKLLAERREGRLAKKAYELFKVKQLRGFCEEQGLPTTGTEEDLIWRHSQWVIFYNANLDREVPKPLEELKAELKELEKEKKGSKKALFKKKSKTQANIDWGHLIQDAKLNKEKLLEKLNNNKSKKDDNNNNNSNNSNYNINDDCNNDNNDDNNNDNNNNDVDRGKFKGKEDEDGEDKKEEENLFVPDGWQVVWSDALKKPFYYNEESKIGTFTHPSEL